MTPNSISADFHSHALADREQGLGILPCSGRWSIVDSSRIFRNGPTNGAFRIGILRGEIMIEAEGLSN